MFDQHNLECRLAQLVATARLEIVPVAGVLDRVVNTVPSGTTLTITCSPKHGVQRTVESAEHLAAQGYRVVPHLAASGVQGKRHLLEIVKRLASTGVDEVFAVGGDGRSDAEAFASAVELVDALRSVQDGPSRIGVAAYPEGHPTIPDEVLATALKRKAQNASYVIPQMCMNPSSMRSWLRRMSEQHPGLPVVLGPVSKLAAAA